MSTEDRHQKVLPVSAELLAEALVTMGVLPTGTRIAWAEFKPYRAQVELLVEHEAFPANSEGCIPPIMDTLDVFAVDRLVSLRARARNAS